MEKVCDKIEILKEFYKRIRAKWFSLNSPTSQCETLKILFACLNKNEEED